MELSSFYDKFISSSGVQTDTRSIVSDCMFFCLKGANFNGNKFAQEALDKGAKYVIVDEAEYCLDDRCVLVENVLECLQNLARYHRRQFNIPVLGITGSNGKTTSKELITAVLSQKFNVHYTKGNLNNHIGVPLTLLQLNKRHEIAIVEMGANKPGDIQELVEIAEPTHGIITNVGRAHLEGFGSLEGVVKTKTEMYRFIQGKGVLFINAQDVTLKQNLPKDTEVIEYNGGNISGQLIRLTPFVEMTWSNKEINFISPIIKTNLVGEYNFLNFLAAIAIGTHFGVSSEKCNEAIENYIPSNNRSQVTKTERNTLIVDCYNANPTSMASALSSFAKIDNTQKVFILGDMFEMGDESSKVHEEVVQQTIELGLSGFFIGEAFLQFKGMHPSAIFLKSTTPLIEHFEQAPPRDLLILLKGSRGIALEKVIPFL